MFIKSIKIDGLLSFAPGSPPIELRPLNVIIGPNGAGKSNLITVMETLRDMIDYDHDNGPIDGLDLDGEFVWVWNHDLLNGIRRGSVELHTFATERMGSLRYAVEFVDGRDNFSETIENGAERVFWMEDDTACVSVAGSDGTRRVSAYENWHCPMSVLAQLRDPLVHPEITQLSSEMLSIRLFRDWNFGGSAPVRRRVSRNASGKILWEDARNLANVLRLMDGQQRERLNRCMHSLMPRYDSCETRDIGDGVEILLREKGQNRSIGARNMSEGTLRVIALNAALFGGPPPSLLCIEEPELGLHPDAHSIVGELLIEASRRTQVIVTTHSDALLSSLNQHVDSVLVCEYDNGTRLRRLERAKLQHWLKKYALGDIWRMGEIGGNP